MKTAAKLSNVTFTYSNGEGGALSGVDLEIGRGECVLLCGCSGCGKTTVTRLINGLIPHYYEGSLEGEAVVSGRNVSDTPIEDLAGVVGSVFQNPRSQFFCVDTTAEIAFGCENMGLPEDEVIGRINKTVADMKIEKLIAYIFLTFILMVACFNIIGSLSMLIIDKKDDVVTLRNLGATDRQITQVFLFEGRIISAIGAIIGILIGLLLCWIQQTFGIISLGSSEGAFVINAYPVSVHPLDIIIIFITVLAVGFLSVWYPVHYFSKRLLT